MWVDVFRKYNVFFGIVIAAVIISLSIYFSPFAYVPDEQVNTENTDSPAITEFVGEKFVSRVIDGDTVVIEGQSVRLLGIDAEERGQDCYTPAKERLEDLVLDKNVILEADTEDKDRYDRYLRYIFVNHTNVNKKLVEEGLAIALFYENVKYKEEIVNAEKEARASATGCKWAG